MSQKDTVVAEAREILDVAIGHGVRNVVVSPGSRNAPLLIAAAGRDILKKYVVSDERTAGFIALGIATATSAPVALICTSGTALLNYSPAIAEAYYRHIPLIVISADRPEEWIDQDDSQTIRQFEALHNFVKNSYDIEASTSSTISPVGLVNRLANDALITSMTEPLGPVHINLRLHEPLGNTLERVPRTPRIITKLTGTAKIPRETLNTLASEARGKKVMIVCGFMNPDNKMIRALRELESIPNVCVMAETVANFSGSGDAHCVDLALATLSDETRKTLSPDIVISVGGALISRKLKEFLRESGAVHWGVGYFHTTVDCFRSLQKRIEVDPPVFLRALASVFRRYFETSVAHYADDWKRIRTEAIRRRDHLVENAPWSELKVFDILARFLNRDVNLHLSNGTSVRYGQLFDFDVHATYCNRGVSGIDGSTSTAIGASLSYSGPTVLITGDMSFAYDLGGLATKLAPQTMKIIVVNNQGGAIFRFVNSTASLPEEIREHYFCADPKTPVKELAEAYEWAYSEADNPEKLEMILPSFLTHSQRAILMIRVPADTGGVMLRRLLSKN